MKLSRRLALSCALAALASGCALGPNSSYVAPLRQAADAQILADGTATFIAMQLPAASTTVVLDPTPSDQARNAFTPALAAALRRQGFAIADPAQPIPMSAHYVRYLVTPLDNGDLVRLTLDDTTEASRFFARTADGGLRAGGPLMMTQAEAPR